MALSPSFANVPVSGIAKVSTANTARDGTGTIVDLITAGASGTRIDSIYCVNTDGSSTAGVLRFFLHNGTEYSLFYEVLVSAMLASNTAMGWSATLENLGWVVPSGYKIGVSISTSDAFNVVIVKAGNL